MDKNGALGDKEPIDTRYHSGLFVARAKKANFFPKTLMLFACLRPI
jgi:hypothetical protein